MSAYLSRKDPGEQKIDHSVLPDESIHNYLTSFLEIHEGEFKVNIKLSVIENICDHIFNLEKELEKKAN